MSLEQVPPNPIAGPSPDSTGASEADSRQAALRKRAEALAEEKKAGLPASLETHSAETARALHELQVHQIELEMQNEELRRTQEDLEVSRARYFDLYDLAPVGYFTLSDKGLILEANLTAAKLLGVARGALVRQPLSHFILPEDQDVHYRQRKQLLETGAPQSWELRLLRKDAAPFWARLEATTQQGADGPALWRAVASDIDKSKLMEEEKAQLEAQNRQLQKAEGFGRMAAAIAHRFNNYLAAVMGNLELALGKLPPGVGVALNLADAMRVAGEAAEVSGLMLTYLGQTHAQREPLDLSEVCHRSLPLLRAAIPKHMVLDTDLPSPGPSINGNANQIQQVLTSLVTNAGEAGGAGRSAVRLTVKAVPQAGISASHCFPADWRPGDRAYACLEVVDAGSGIAKPDIEKLFDPFFSSKFPGRGLGLSVVLGIVRAHGGGITVESEPGRGSAFRVFLPVSAGKVLRQPDQTPRRSGPQAAAGMDWSGTLLLVEDEPMVRKMGEATLAKLGFTVLLAGDGVEALEVFRRHLDEVRCVICDLTMPRMNGWETLAALRKLAPGLPVILASGYDMAQVMEGEHPELPQAFLSKPYRLQGLRDAICSALANGKESKNT